MAAIAADILTRRWLHPLEPSQVRSPEGCVHPVTSIDALKCPEARAPMIAVPCGTEDRKKTTYSGGTVQALDLLPRLRSRM